MNASDKRAAANREAFERLTKSEPVLVDVAPAIDVVAGMTENTVLTSGPPLPWEAYEGGQRDAVIGGALFEGLAETAEEAAEGFASGRLKVDGCHAYGCIGSLAGIYTASMPVFVVRNDAYDTVGYCNMYEGKSPKRLNYGVYDDDVHAQLTLIGERVAPAIGAATRALGGIPLKPIMSRALHMGDELHSRNTAASLLFARELAPAFLDLDEVPRDDVRETLRILTEDHYFFLRLSMASAKAIADAAHGIEHSSIVTAMCFSCAEFGIRVSGLGDEWIRGPHASVQAKLFDGHTEDEISWMGGESPITETVGLGGFAQAAAFPLQAYQGGDPQAMVERNLELYGIVEGEHPDFHIPFLKYRGTPTGIDVLKVAETGILPVMDIGIAGKGGGQIGAGTVRAPMECFQDAVEKLNG
jgi:hypothetical protein